MDFRLPLLFLSVFMSAALSDCSNASKREPASVKNQDGNESLMEVNKNLVKMDDEKIRKYIERNKLKMKETGTGLRYSVWGEGIGENARNGQYALVKYKLSLLDGTLCYSSDKNGPQEFLIGMDNVESGLHEGITYMKSGQKAKFILPPHLAHGLVGDDNKIPARSVVIYDVELLSLR